MLQGFQHVQRGGHPGGRCAGAEKDNRYIGDDCDQGTQTAQMAQVAADAWDAAFLVNEGSKPQVEEKQSDDVDADKNKELEFDYFDGAENAKASGVGQLCEQSSPETGWPLGRGEEEDEGEEEEGGGGGKGGGGIIIRRRKQ